MGLGKVEGAAGDKAARLEQSVAEDAYAALQTYKTFHARAAKKGSFEVAIDLLRSGSIVLLKHGHTTAGTELALLLVETLETNKIEQSEELTGIVLKVNEAFETCEVPESAKPEALKNQARFLKAAIAWSTLAHCGQHPKGDPSFHLMAAKAKVRRGDLPGAASNFLHSRKPKEFAAFLYQVSCKAYASERDLILARAVLQLLALENLKDANIVYETYIGIHVLKKTPVPDSPLANFIRFLLKTLERDAYPLFKMLCEKYAPSINRDGTFQVYLDRIQELFFGVKPQKKGLQAMMDSMLGMFGGN